jgi:hypothetical protein
MARPLRIEHIGGWYHVNARGNERRAIYRDDRGDTKGVDPSYWIVLAAPRQSEVMARKLRVEYPGAIYQVMNRRDRREAIFRVDADRELFLETLGEACVKAGWQEDQAMGAISKKLTNEDQAMGSYLKS